MQGGVHGRQEPETASVIKVVREPAIIINGVPNLPPDSTAHAQVEIRHNAESEADPCFGEWLEGRKVRKLFGDRYYFGKVVKYDSENNWYGIAYEDGDQEDLEWHELEEVLLPLDITIPLKILAMEKCKLEKTVSESRPKVGRPRKISAKSEGSMEKTTEQLPVSKSSDVMSNQLLVLRMEKTQELKPKVGRPRKIYAKSEGSMEKTPELLPAPRSSDLITKTTELLPVSKSSDVMSNQLSVLRVEKTQESKPKVGRPRKIYAKSEGSMEKTPELLPAPKSSDVMSNQSPVLKMEEKTQEPLNGSNQPRKRGRPRKVRITSDNPQSAESIPSSSLALVLASAANTVENASMTNDVIAQETLRRQREILRSNMQTARAEKQKRRENSRVQGTSSGTQLF